MADNIFLIDQNNKLSQLTAADYESEALLQKLIADHPEVLGGATTQSGNLLLIKREQPVPDAIDGSGRWALDHLFVDRNAVPVLVEVKRASDTRARREVVAQMLDYAANGVAYWPIDEIVASFEKTAAEDGGDPTGSLTDFLEGTDPETFWRSVESNLRSGRIRMIFLADSISKELRRIVEFLNEQMRPAEVLAVEVKQFVAPNGLRTLVPSLVGATERAQSSKSILGAREKIDRQQWLDSLGEMKGIDFRKGAEKVLEWFASQHIEVGIASTQDSLYAQISLGAGKSVYPFFLRRSTGNFEVSLQSLRNAPFYASDESRLNLLNQIKQTLAGYKISTAKATGPARRTSTIRCA